MYLNLTLLCNLCYARAPTILFFPPHFFLIVIIGTNFILLVLGYDRESCAVVCLGNMVFIRGDLCVPTPSGSLEVHRWDASWPGGGAVDQVGTASLPHVNDSYCHQAGHGNSHSPRQFV